MTIEIDPARYRRTEPSYAVQLSAESGDGSSPSNAPTFKRPEYEQMENWWKLCQDVKGGTERLRERRSEYLPKFSYEDADDWEARVKMTFCYDHYEQTLDDLTGLLLSQPPQLGKDVPDQLRALMENVDGRGSTLAVFAREFLEKAMDYGHAGIFVDFPQTPTDRRVSLAEFKARRFRPYWRIVGANDIPNWQTTVIGGEEVLTLLELCEERVVPVGVFGCAREKCYREYRQEVVYTVITNTAADGSGSTTKDVVPAGLGAITWKLWCKIAASSGASDVGVYGGYYVTETGTITGPTRIPFAITYGGKRLGFLHSKPFLYALAWANLEETQVNSDYAWAMHIANVPTPYFIGRRNSQTEEPVKMGSGIDIPMGGSAGMLEPSGNSFGATRTRMEDIRGQMRRQGATLHVDEQQMTATEAAIAARQRNARLAAVAAEAPSAFEQALAYTAAFAGVAVAEGATGAKGGGSVSINTDFAQVGYDAAFVAECRLAWMEGALPLEAYLHVLKTGRLPEEFEVEKIALQMASEARARSDAAAEQFKQQGASGIGGGGGGGGEAKPPAPTSATEGAQSRGDKAASAA